MDNAAQTTRAAGEKSFQDLRLAAMMGQTPGLIKRIAA